jgi:hypothetical protein
MFEWLLHALPGSFAQHRAEDCAIYQTNEIKQRKDFGMRICRRGKAANNGLKMGKLLRSFCALLRLLELLSDAMRR